jgi:16S rRNA processing protein RimM
MEWVIVAKIIRPHSIKGNVVVRSFCSPPSKFIEYSPLFFKDKTEVPMKVIKSLDKNDLLCRISGINDRNAAELLKDETIQIRKEQLPNVEEDNVFYCNDLIGLTVISAIASETLGTISYVHDFGAGAVLEVKATAKEDDGNKVKVVKSLYVSFNNDAVVDVDLENKKVTINKEFLV